MVFGSNNNGAMILLNPLQSITIHGWLNPKRTLCWEDVLKYDELTVMNLVDDGMLRQEDLKLIQPNIYEWIEKKYVSYEDVPYMTCFPLDPIIHLHGDISTLATYKYSFEVLQEIGMNFSRLKQLHLNPRWMSMMDLTLKEWIQLGMTTNDINNMSDDETREVFGGCKSVIKLSIGMTESFLK